MTVMSQNLRFIRELITLVQNGNINEVRKKALWKYINLLRRWYALFPHQGTRVTEEDWDYLIILDACRFDDFAHNITLPGRLEKRITRGTNTSQWLRENFTDFYDNVTYISSNPRCSDHEIDGFCGTQHFPHVEPVWQYGWDDDLDTVPPQEMTQAALRLHNQYPDRKMIVHYIQPHGPWIGKTRLSVQEIGFDATYASSSEKWVVDVMAWDRVKEGTLDVQLLRQATIDNLLLVLEEVEKLVEQLEGKIVITADHGEAFGEYFVFEHPSSVYIKALAEVPWFVIDKGKRRLAPLNKVPVSKATSLEESQPVNSGDQEVLEERLRALGYLR